MNGARIAVPGPWWTLGRDEEAIRSDAAGARHTERPSLPGPHVVARGPQGPLQSIPVRSLNRIVLVQVEHIVRLEADDNYVRIWADRMYMHKETLTALVARLDPAEFLRIHRSHAVRIACVRELQPRLHGEFLVRLHNGVELTSGRSYRAAIRGAFGLR